MNRNGDRPAPESLAPRYAFGLRVDSTVALETAPLATAGDLSRRASLQDVPAERLASFWAPGATSLVDRRTPTGRLVMAVDVHPEHGYRIAAPRYGIHLVSADGTSILSSLPSIAPWRWQRLLFAQVLPLAAALQGLDVFHASAVALDGKAAAFVAASGTGKTSVAMHLVGRGASFVTDDVLALEVAGDGVRAHPGGGVASIHAGELRAIEARLGAVVGRGDKLQIAVPTVGRSLPLSALYFLERGHGELEIVETHDSALLLGSSFLRYLDSPEMLWRHLEVCARIAQSVRLFRVLVPESESARDAAGEIEEHLGVTA